MKQISIYPVIVKSKVLNDGTHRIRIAVSHNNATRYLPTRFVVPSPNNLKRGEVCGVPNSNVINRNLRKRIDELYSLYDTIPHGEILSCSQIIEIFKDGGLEQPTTIKEILEEWVSSKPNIKESSANLYRKGISYFMDYMGEDYVLSRLTPSVINGYIRHLKKTLNPTTITMKISNLHSLVNFAVQRGFVKFNIDPFVDYRKLPSIIRDVALNVSQLRRLRDAEIDSLPMRAARDYFMFSFYLCGMNYADYSTLDLTKDIIRFKRKKTENRREEYTAFTMPKEARAIADTSLDRNRIVLGMRYTPSSLHSIFYLQLPKLREMIIPDCERLIMYSARKTFAQICAELGVSDAIIEYCLGDASSKSKSITYYRKVTMEMADREIRRVLDFVASDLTIDEYLKGASAEESLPSGC